LTKTPLLIEHYALVHCQGEEFTNLAKHVVLSNELYLPDAKELTDITPTS
jgi:hypothetical protein